LNALWPATKIQSTIDHDPILCTKKFKEFEGAVFEIIRIKVLNGTLI